MSSESPATIPACFAGLHSDFICPFPTVTCIDILVPYFMYLDGVSAYFVEGDADRNLVGIVLAAIDDCYA